MKEISQMRTPSGMNQGPTVVLGTETGIRHICSWEFQIFEGNVNHALVKQIMASFKLKPGFMNVSLMILVIRDWKMVTH